jgi:hypothetical protein
MGTIIGSDPNVGSNAINATYNDLLAIWDAYNGTSTSMGGAALPSSWQVADYFSSTPFPGGADYWDVWMWDGGTGNHAGSGGAATYVALQVLQVTSLAVTNTSGSYASSTNTLVLTGSNYSSLLQTGETASTDIKARLDWSKLSWDIDGNTTGTTDIGFALSDISSAKVTDSTHLTIVLSNAKASSLEAASGYAGSTLDKLDITTGFARDAVGNVATTDGVVNAPLSVPSAGDAVIDLGSYGKLFLPVQVEGTWYYHWDRSGDGNSWDSADKFTHDELDLIFKYDINGNEGTGGTTDTYRYATLNGIKVALPTINMSGEFAKYFTGTASVDNQIPSNNTSSPLYDEWLAIWDAWNGSGVENGANVNTTDFGSPKMNITQYDGRTWQTQYWTATANPANAQQHYKFQLNGLGIALGDTESAWVALKVL